MPVPTDDGADLALEVEPLAPGRHGHRIVGADESARIREVEDGELEELPGQLVSPPPGQHLDVLPERHEVPHGGGSGNGREQANLVDVDDGGRVRYRPLSGSREALAVIAEQIDELRPRGHRVDPVVAHHADPLGV